MGLFSKEEKVSFSRDEKGNVVDVQRRGNIEKKSRTPVYDALTKKDKKTNPSRFEQYRQRKAEERQIYQQAYQKARKTSIKKRASRDARRMYDTTPFEKLATFSSTSSKRKRKPSHMNANPFGDLFDTGISSPSKKKSSKKQKGMGGFDVMDNWGLL